MQERITEFIDLYEYNTDRVEDVRKKSMIENFLIECYAQQLGTNNTQTFQTFDHACKVHFC